MLKSSWQKLYRVGIIVKKKCNIFDLQVLATICTLGPQIEPLHQKLNPKDPNETVTTKNQTRSNQCIS